MTLETGQEHLVGIVRRDFLATRRPGIQDGTGSLGVFRLTRNLPAERQLEGGCGLLVTDNIVLLVHTGSGGIPADDGFKDFRSHRFLGPGIVAKLQPGGIDGVGGVRRRDGRPDAGQVVRIDIGAGMAEGHRHRFHGFLGKGQVRDPVHEILVAGRSPQGEGCGCGQGYNDLIHTKFRFWPTRRRDKRLGHPGSGRCGTRRNGRPGG